MRLFFRQLSMDETVFQSKILNEIFQPNVTQEQTDEARLFLLKKCNFVFLNKK